MTAEVDAATEKRKAAEKRAKEKHDFVLRTAEQSMSVFDDDARQVSGYTAQFVAQEDADMKLAKSKLENKWFGPQIDDLDENASLNLSGKVRVVTRRQVLVCANGLYAMFLFVSRRRQDRKIESMPVCRGGVFVNCPFHPHFLILTYLVTR